MLQSGEIVQPLRNIQIYNKSEIHGHELTHFQLRKLEAAANKRSGIPYQNFFERNTVHARPPSAKKRHPGWKHEWGLDTGSKIVQIGIDTRNVGISDHVGKWFKPPFRLPCVCIGPPYLRIAI